MSASTLDRIEAMEQSLAQTVSEPPQETVSPDMSELMGSLAPEPAAPEPAAPEPFDVDSYRDRLNSYQLEELDRAPRPEYREDLIRHWESRGELAEPASVIPEAPALPEPASVIPEAPALPEPTDPVAQTAATPTSEPSFLSKVTPYALGLGGLAALGGLTYGLVNQRSAADNIEEEEEEDEDVYTEPPYPYNY